VRTAVVPDVKGLHLALAQALLEDDGFRVDSVITGKNPPRSTHEVYAESPAPGSRVARHSVIVLKAKVVR
jgi:beta-lactam-binding protein with PASTA domain